MDDKIAELNKEKWKINGYNETIKVRDCEVNEWLTKIVLKVDSHFGENIHGYMETKTMTFIFEMLCVAITKQLEQILIDEEGEPDIEEVQANENIYIEVPDEYLQKNVRVEPP